MPFGPPASSLSIAGPESRNERRIAGQGGSTKEHMKKAKRKFYSIFHKYVIRVHPDNPIAEKGMAHNYRQHNRTSKINKRYEWKDDSRGF